MKLWMLQAYNLTMQEKANVWNAYDTLCKSTLKI